ncbi:MAG: hypothetical protein PHT05_07505 [Clostridia bacterium]|nr:hypothetical protein [Clostridia bacterium]
MRKRNFKKLAALFIIAVYALSTFAFASAAEDKGIAFDFEDGIQGWSGVGQVEIDNGWVDANHGISEFETSKDEAADGEQSLKVIFKPGEGRKIYHARMPLEGIEPGQKVTAKVFIPDGTNINLIHLFAQGNDWGWDNTEYKEVKEGEWLELEHVIAEDIELPLQRVALQFEFAEDLDKDLLVYVDSVKVGALESDEEPVDEDDKDDEKPVDEDDKEDEKPADEDDKKDNEKDKEPEKPKSVSFTFEEDLQGWTGIDQAEVDAKYDETVDVTTLSRSDEQAADGKYSLKAVFEPGNVHYQARMPIDNVTPGQKVTFKVYIPKGTNLKGYQIFSQGAEDWSYWHDKWFDVKEEGVWLEGEYTIPEDIKDPIQRVALQFVFDKALDKEAFVYIDSVVLGADDDEVPAKTGYASTLGYLLLAAASAGVIAKKKRK